MFQLKKTHAQLWLWQKCKHPTWMFGVELECWVALVGTGGSWLSGLRLEVEKVQWPCQACDGSYIRMEGVLHLTCKVTEEYTLVIQL